MSDLFAAAGLDQGAPTPLAERLRPKKLDEVVGQDHLLKAEGPIGRMVANKRLASMILWGPPGVGKTTIARLLAEETGHEQAPRLVPVLLTHGSDRGSAVTGVALLLTEREGAFTYPTRVVDELIRSLALEEAVDPIYL